MDDATGHPNANTGTTGPAVRRIEDQRRRVVQNPEVPGPRHRLAEMLKAAGRLAEAEILMRETLALFPNNRRAKLELAALASAQEPEIAQPAARPAAPTLAAPVQAPTPAADVPAPASDVPAPASDLPRRPAYPRIVNQDVPGLSTHFPTFSRATRTPLFTTPPPPGEAVPRPAANAARPGRAGDDRPIIPLDTPATEIVSEGWDPPGREWLVIGALALLFGGLWAKEAWFPAKPDVAPAQTTSPLPVPPAAPPAASVLPPANKQATPLADQIQPDQSEPGQQPQPGQQPGRNEQSGPPSPPQNKDAGPPADAAQPQEPAPPAIAPDQAAAPQSEAAPDAQPPPPQPAPAAPSGNMQAPAAALPAPASASPAPAPPALAPPAAGPTAAPDQQTTATLPGHATPPPQSALPPLPEATYVPPLPATPVPGVQQAAPEAGTMPASVFILFDPQSPTAPDEAASLAQRIRQNHMAGAVSVAAALGTIHGGMTYFHPEDRAMAIALASRLGHMGQVRRLPPTQQDALPPGTIAIGVK